MITVKYGDTEVEGSPFEAKAFNTGAIEVTNLPDGVVGQPIEFGSMSFHIYLFHSLCKEELFFSYKEYQYNETLLTTTLTNIDTKGNLS